MVLEKELNISNENYHRYQSLKQDIEDIKRIKKELCLGQKLNGLNKGKKIQNTFFNLENRNYNMKYIKDF